MIHAETFSLLLDTYIQDPRKNYTPLRAIEAMPSAKRKTDWTNSRISSDAAFDERIIAFDAVEGSFLSGSFCTIVYLNRRRLMLVMTLLNELITRDDERLHFENAYFLYAIIPKEMKLSQQRMVEIFGDPVEYVHFLSVHCQ